jgi:hypothetical protein
LFNQAGAREAGASVLVVLSSAVGDAMLFGVM